MYPGAGRADDRLVLVFGNIWIVIQFVLDVEAGCRAPENELAHSFNLMAPGTPDHDLAQVDPAATRHVIVQGGLGHQAAGRAQPNARSQ